MRRAILLLLVMGSCQYVPDVLPEPGPREVPDVFTGTSALEARFAEGSLKEIFMCQQADVFVEVRNRGAARIDGEYVFIVEDQVMRPVDGQARTGRLSLEEKSQFNPQGGFSQVKLSVENVGLPAQLSSYASPVIFQACYPYATFASVPVCIDPDVQGVNPAKACRAQPVSLSGGQGAPVAVTRVEPRMSVSGDVMTPLFAVYLQNRGSGRVVSAESWAEACKPGNDDGLKDQLPRVSVKATLQENELECRPNPVRLRVGEEARIICEPKENELEFGPQAGTFSTLLSVELGYGYVNAAMFPVTIARLPHQETCEG